jgi:hypothetical protein
LDPDTASENRSITEENKVKYIEIEKLDEVQLNCIQDFKISKCLKYVQYIGPDLS